MMDRYSFFDTNHGHDTPARSVEEYGYMSWPVMYWGVVMGYASLADASRFAETQLVAASPASVEALACIASYDSVERRVLVGYLQRLAECESGHAVADHASGRVLAVWRLGILDWLGRQGLEFDRLCDALSEVASDFGFPDDMVGTSRYDSVTDFDAAELSQWPSSALRRSVSRLRGLLG